MSSIVPYNPLPSEGDILLAKFPLVESLGSPGPKCRPVLVLSYSAADHSVIVAYGTSVRTDKLFPGEFLLDPLDPGFSLSGLSYRTKFNLARVVQLPFDSDWFTPVSSVYVSSPLPKLGVLHPSYAAAYLAAEALV
ncbi:type II toxin-antitoxin system PemK/MazF family toxin [Pseudomonas syringae]|uniref:type II toxin-antitoxin system PemK/MazF family toxin n=1 Tax=Pseudomonas syringae TaxID=317 RepID=UPI003F74C1FD